MTRIFVRVAAFALLACAGCNENNNLLLGRVQADVGSHRVVVTDCYRTKVPAPERMQNGDFHYMPCRDAEVWIRGDQLTVNGRPYGHLEPRDGILVDHGVVSINRGTKQE